MMSKKTLQFLPRETYSLVGETEVTKQSRCLMERCTSMVSAGNKQRVVPEEVTAPLGKEGW